MKELFTFAKEVQDYFYQQKWQFCFIGGLALQRWGQPRLTNDVDLCLLSGFGNEERFIDPLLQRFVARRKDARDFAILSRVLLLKHPIENIGLDISLGAFPFEENAFKRSTEYEFLPDIVLRTCSAEDLIIFKAFANRPQDWVDISGIIVRNNALDRDIILSELKILVELKEEPEIYDKFKLLKNKIEKSLKL